MAVRYENGVFVDGLEEAIIAFNKITDEKANAFVVAGSKEAAGVILEAAKARVSVGATGNLKASLQIKQVRARANKRYSRHVSQPVYTVGPKYVTSLGKGGVNYGHLVELGHKIKIGGKVVGSSKDRPYLRPAADTNKEQVVKIIADALNASLEMWGED